MADMNDKSPHMQPTMVRLPPEMHEAVKALAEAEGRTMALTIRRAVRQYLEREAEASELAEWDS